MKVCCEYCGHGMFVGDSQLMELKQMGKKVLCFDCDVEASRFGASNPDNENARPRWERATFGSQTLDRFCEEKTV